MYNEGIQKMFCGKQIFPFKIYSLQVLMLILAFAIFDNEIKLPINIQFPAPYSSV